MKSNTRKRLALIRDTLSNGERKTFSESIKNNLVKLDVYKKAKTVLLYCSFGSEVETRPLIKKLLKDKKTTLLPVIIPKTKTIKALEIKNFEKDTQVGHLKITEPKNYCKEFAKNEIDLIIAPGIAFGEKGERLGYGKGFYDRFLHGYNGIIIGICFENQVTDQIILEEHDVKMHKIVTEKRVVDCNS